MEAVILASGFNVRLRGITHGGNKTLLPLGNRVVLDYIIDTIPLGIPITVTCNKAHYRDFDSWAVKQRRVKELYVEDVENIYESTGTVGSLEDIIKRNHIHDDLMVLGGDCLWGVSLNGMVSDFYYRFGEPALVMVSLAKDKAEASRHGVVEISDGRISSFMEKPENPTGVLNIAHLCYIFPKSWLGDIHNNNLFKYVNRTVGQEDVPGGKMPRAGDLIRWFVENNYPVYPWGVKHRVYHLGVPEDYDGILKIFTVERENKK